MRVQLVYVDRTLQFFLPTPSLLYMILELPMLIKIQILIL